MNISNRISRKQSGIALIIFLTVIVLGTATFLVSQANNSRFQHKINAQKQTAKVLQQAKEALLGFAAVYAETHPNQPPQGYLPCPDFDGDGSSDILGTTCGSEGESMLGRFPWRTLGLPVLRDGNGDCLWYAVSGNYKDKPKSALTSDTPGLFIVENINGDKIAGGTCVSSICTPEEIENNEAKQAIAIIFSSGKIIEGQNRTTIANNSTVCGSTNTSDDINQASNYLDSFNVGYTIDNSNGTKSTLPTKKNSVFIKAPLTYYIDNNGKIDNERVIFNDILMLITRQDFEHIYERMDFWVAEEVSRCLERSVGSAYQNNFLNNVFLEAIGNWKFPEVGTYRAYPPHVIKIQEYIDDKVASCKDRCDKTLNSCNSRCDNCEINCKGDTDCENKCEDVSTCKIDCNDNNIICKSDTYGCDRATQKDSHRKNAIYVEQRFPWVADITDTSCFNNISYTDSAYNNFCQPVNGKRFGRIPNIPNDTNNGMLKQWTSGCFKNFWWDGWKDKVFYAIEDDYTANNITHFWIKSVRRAWNGETWKDFKDRQYSNKKNTFARIQESDTTKWELTTIPIPPANEVLQLNDKVVKKFTILVSGRRINTQTRVEDSDKMNINNYLEGNNNLNYNYINSNTCPSDNATSPSLPTCNFKRKRTDESFNDVVCKDRWKDCMIPK